MENNRISDRGNPLWEAREDRLAEIVHQAAVNGRKIIELHENYMPPGGGNFAMAVVMVVEDCDGNE